MDMIILLIKLLTETVSPPYDAKFYLSNVDFKSIFIILDIVIY